jgi:hypothetical protein
VEQLSDSGKEESTTSNEVENTEDADDDHEEITTYSEQIPDSIGA